MQQAIKNSQHIKSEEENIKLNPVTVAVNSGASLSAPQRASIARKQKLPTNKGNNKSM